MLKEFYENGAMPVNHFLEAISAKGYFIDNAERFEIKYSRTRSGITPCGLSPLSIRFSPFLIGSLDEFKDENGYCKKKIAQALRRTRLFGVKSDKYDETLFMRAYQAFINGTAFSMTWTNDELYFKYKLELEFHVMTGVFEILSEADLADGVFVGFTLSLTPEVRPCPNPYLYYKDIAHIMNNWYTINENLSDFNGYIDGYLPQLGSFGLNTESRYVSNIETVTSLE